MTAVKKIYQGQKLVKEAATGSGAIAHSFTVVSPGFLVGASVHFNTQPITSENLTVTLDQNEGAEYDIQLSSSDPSSAGDLAYFPSVMIPVHPGDIITVGYTNTDGRTYGSMIYLLES